MDGVAPGVRRLLRILCILGGGARRLPQLSQLVSGPRWSAFDPNSQEQKVVLIVIAE